MIIRSKAPLRLGLAGGGTDVSPYSDLYGGFVLNATIDMHAYCTIEVTDDQVITIVDLDSGLHFTQPAAPRLEIDGELDLQKGVYNRIVKDFTQGKPLSFSMTTHSDALAGSGLGSSSTLVVAVLTAFSEWLNLPFGEYDLANLACQIERVDLGFSGGKQDQYAATFGGFNFMEFYAEDRVIVNPLRIKRWIVDELQASMVLYFTGISRESARIIEEQTKNVHAQNQPSIDAMHQLKADSRVLKEALLRGDICEFGSVVGRSWEAKKAMAHSISNPEIDAIYDRAREAGAVSGKVTGAGGGGFLMLFTNPLQKPDLIKSLNEGPGRVFNFSFTKEGAVAWKVL